MVERPDHYRRRGDIDEVQISGVRGWSVDPEDPDRTGAVELWLDGSFVAAAEANLFRRDLQDRFGGQGNVGFFIEHKAGWPQGRGFRLELRDQASGKLLKRLDRAPMEPKPDRSLDLKNDLATAKRLLNNIEQRLRDEELVLANRLERYDLYYDQVYRGRVGSNGGVVTLRPHVIISLGAASARQVEQALASLAGSDLTGPDHVSVVTSDQAQINLLRDLVARFGWAGLKGLGEDADRIVCANLDEAIARAGTAQVVVLVPATGFMADGALARLLAPFADPQILLAYADEDALASEYQDYQAALHRDPRLKPAYDADLLLQTPYLGEMLAVRPSLLNAIDTDGEAPHLALQAQCLKQSLSSDQIAHLDRVLFTRFYNEGDSDAADPWPDHVRPLLGEGVSLDPLEDVLGASVPGASRIRRKVTGRAAIIIPTRNGLDLLKPCVESILRSLPSNQVSGEIIIINHQSDDPATLDYMAGLKQRGQARIIDYSGPFNWALMNNLAVQETEAEVLVFLNNDTLVISPDWIDALSAQALRPEVGIVGARLLYQNGTIQHAGFVWREGNPGFLIHDGIGIAGSDGGYLGRHALTHACVAVTGACMAVATETFKALGGFDSAHFPVECNDVDLCLRAWDRGYRVLYEPGATLYHLESISRGFSRDGEKLKVAQRANAVMLERWGQGDRRDPWFNTHFSREGRPFERLRPPR